MEADLRVNRKQPDIARKPSLGQSARYKSRVLIILVLVISLSWSKSLGADKQMKIVNPVNDAGLVVLDATSPGFLAETQTLLTPEAIAKASSFLPQSLVVINNTGQFVWGFTVVYRYPDWISPAGTPWKHRISPSGGGPADRTRMLAPGARFLITPVSDFLASSTAKGDRILQPFLDEGMDRMISQFQAQHPNRSERVEVVVDSVIFEDGSMGGPDSEGMMEKINERIRAEKDLATSLNNLKGEELKGKLLLHSHKAMGDEYSGRSSAVAQSLLAVLNEHGETAALEIVQKMRSSRWFVNSENVRRK